MADVRESFTTLEGASQEGLALRAVQQGDSVAAKNGSIAVAFKDNSGNGILPVAGVAAGAAPTTAIPAMIAVDDSGNLTNLPVKQEGDAPADAIPVLGFKDSAGNLVAPQLNSSGQLPVSLEVSGNSLYARGKVAGNLSQVTVATLALTVDKYYEDLQFIVSCFRDAVFEIIWNNNGSETILAEALCGPGQYTVNALLKHVEFQAGSTGTQQILVKAINLNATSDFRATVSVVEI
jgi:hypothetical protein